MSIKAAIVIKKDGRVPFEQDVPEVVKQHMLGHLIYLGHELNAIPGTNDYKVKVWPPVKPAHLQQKPPAPKAQ